MVGTLPPSLFELRRTSRFAHPTMSEFLARSFPNPVIASAAKQSRIFPRWQSGLLRCARNDGARCIGVILQHASQRCRHAVPSSRRNSPELCFVAPPSKPRGRREGRVLTSHPRSAARKVAQKNRTAAYRWCQSLGLPCAVVGRLMPCSPGSRVPSGLPHPSGIHRHRAG